MDILKEKPVLIVALSIFLVSVLFHGILAFHFLPEKIVFTKYQTVAKEYMDGKISNERLLDVSPLYLFLNITAAKFSGKPYGFMLRVQVVLMSLAAALLFLLLKSFFNLSLSIAGAGAFVINKSVILYTRAMEPEPLIIFFMLGFIFFASRSTNTAAVLSGVFLGFSVLTRSNFFPIALIVPLLFFFKYGKENRKKWLRPSLLFGIPVFIVISFLAVRNSGLAGSFTLFQMNPGQVVFEGNNPNSWGESAVYPPLVNDYAWQFTDQADYQHVVYRQFARKITNENLTLNQVNWFWTQKGLNFIVDYPGHFFKRLLAKVNFVFHNYRRHDLANVFWNDQN
ncbi:MAG: hypothetical protein GY950_05845, partial [bacterium]|nr:hypothetical protein [bacterium]